MNLKTSRVSSVRRNLVKFAVSGTAWPYADVRKLSFLYSDIWRSVLYSGLLYA